MSRAAISFAGLGHAYRKGEWIFRDYAASLERGRILTVLGPNGSGKSTLLHALLGILSPTEGHIEITGRAAFVPQLFEVSFDYTALDMVLMGRARRIGLFGQPSAKDEAAALVALDRVGLGDFATHSFHELSGGQRQLVILARALVADADILIMDEPTSSLDLKNQALLLGWIERLAKIDGLTVLFTTHHPQHAIAVADMALLMQGEQHYLYGPSEEVLTEQNLKSLYGVELKSVAFEHGGQTIKSFIPILGGGRHD